MRRFLMLPILIFLTSFSSGRGTCASIIVKGVVVSEKTGRPVQNALVYIIPGEEEALTKENGEFRIETSKHFPVMITAEHQHYKTLQADVKDSRQQIIIRLKLK